MSLCDSGDEGELARRERVNEPACWSRVTSAGRACVAHKHPGLRCEQRDEPTAVVRVAVRRSNGGKVHFGRVGEITALR